MPVEINKKVLSWASDIEESTIEQLKVSSKLPFVERIAVMPDAHWGKGSTVGSVIATKNVIMPSAVGSDIGCGMGAIRLNIKASHLPDDLESWRGDIDKAIPGGVGKGHSWSSNINVKDAIGFTETIEKRNLESKAISQIGSLGGGNHFFEIDIDENEDVWIVLHAGSRGIGKTIADIHIKIAQNLMDQYYIQLENKDLAYLANGTDQFSNYIRDMWWAQKYASLNRDIMMNRALVVVKEKIDAEEVERINCHHNFTQRENHNGKNIWVTRKGAIKADVGDLGIIPGSMATSTYIVEGKGNRASFNSCAHGAGRKFSRREAVKRYTVEDLKIAMQGKAWQEKDAEQLLDEIPAGYKDIEQVMEDQKDLVTIVHKLNQVFNHKGVS